MDGRRKIFHGFMFLLIGFMFLFINISFVSASFSVGNPSHSIATQYGPQGLIRGWINISLSNEPASSVLETGFGDSITLSAIALTNPGAVYSCIPANCAVGYSASNPETEKSFDLNKGNIKTIGLKFEGTIQSVDSIDFIVTSNAPQSCGNQLKVDILDDGIIDDGNNQIGGATCSSKKNYECFEAGGDTDELDIGAEPYCQKITLFESPGFSLGAWVKSVSGTRTLRATLYNEFGGEIDGANCELPQPGSTGGEEVSCDVDYQVAESGEYFVCISSVSGSGDYKVRENSNPSKQCGFTGEPVETPVAAYQIFAEGKIFGPVGSFTVDNSLPNGDNLNFLVQDYIFDNYNNNCATALGGCVVPITFESNEDQTITLSSLSAKYRKSSGQITGKNFFDVGQEIPKVTANFQKLNLDGAEFSAPQNFGSHTFELNLDGQEIFSEEIFVEDVPVIESLSPTVTVAGLPTEFKVKVSGGGLGGVNGSNATTTIINYKWEFGDGDIANTATNSVVHSYNETNLYEMKITITDSNALSSSEIFSVIVGSPKEVINITLKSRLNDLTNSKEQLLGFSTFHQNSLEDILGLEAAEETLERLQVRFAAATSEDDYTKIMGDLVKLRIPKSIIVSKRADAVSFFPQNEVINMDIVEVVGGGNYDRANEQNYIESVFSWNTENIDTKVTYEEISAGYQHSNEAILRVFSLDVKEKSSLNYDYSVVIENIENLKFQEDYFQNEESGYVHIPVSKSESVFVFSTTEDYDFTDLPAFVTPPLNRLNVVSGGSTDKVPKRNPWIIFILIMVFLIILAFIAYIILQEWYKRKYENYLFKNRNDLYNIVTYVNNAKKKGLDDNKIAAHLKKAGWKNEQIQYALKKYGGKRTGMWEIPFKKLSSKFGKGNAQQSPQDARNLQGRGQGNIKRY